MLYFFSTIQMAVFYLRKHGFADFVQIVPDAEDEEVNFVLKMMNSALKMMNCA